LIIVWGCTIQYYIGDNYCRLWESLLTNQKNAMTSRVVNIVNITIFLSVSHELSLFFHGFPKPVVFTAAIRETKHQGIASLAQRC
jgi:hypothetical protein